MGRTLHNNLHRAGRALWPEQFYNSKSLFAHVTKHLIIHGTTYRKFSLIWRVPLSTHTHMGIKDGTLNGMEKIELHLI